MVTAHDMLVQLAANDALCSRPICFSSALIISAL